MKNKLKKLLIWKKWENSKEFIADCILFDKKYNNGTQNKPC